MLTVFTNEGCGACESLKKYLNEKNVTFYEKNVSNPGFRQELLDLGYRSVPLVVSEDGQTSAGFNPLEIETML